MKIVTAAFVLSAAAASATPGIAKDQSQSETARAAAELRIAAQAMVQSQAEPPGQAKRPVDPDQGDDHAAAIAIEKVCSKDNPAAKRSAICPVPVSPS